MANNKASGDPGKFYSLFGGLESYQTYGPGQADYITVPGPNQTGPLINIPLLMQELGQPKATRDQIEGIFDNRPAKDKKLPPKGRMTAQADDGVRSDAMPDAGKKTPSSTPSNKMMKGNKAPPSTDPMSQGPLAGLLALLSGDLFGGSGGTGVTEAPKGGSPFTQMPTEMDLPERNPFFESGPDESILANLIRGPQAMAANQTQEMTTLPPMMQEAQKAKQAAAQPAPAIQPAPVPDNPLTPATPRVAPLRPPMPEMNPAFHNIGFDDMRSLGEMIAEMFGEGRSPNSSPPVPVRNPMFSGGI